MTEPTITALTGIAPAPLVQAGQAADRVAARNLFADYRQRKAAATIAAHDDDLARFAAYLAEAGVLVGNLAADGDAWRGVTWGLVSGFVRWQVRRGYAIASVNRALSTVKAYAKLAAQATSLDTAAYLLIKAVSGYSRKEARRLNEDREQTRKGHKKAQHTSLTTEQARALKHQPNTPQGRRDRLLVCLLVDHGLRVGELASLQLENFDLQAGTFRFYRPKVDAIQTHRLTTDTLRAALAYLQHDAYVAGPLLRGSRKDGQLVGGMNIRAIRKRVGTLGATIGLPNLSPHDLRHYWATDAARNRTDPFALQEAGGWSSLAMPRRYVEAAAIANEGVKLTP